MKEQVKYIRIRGKLKGRRDRQWPKEKVAHCLKMWLGEKILHYKLLQLVHETGDDQPIPYSMD